MNCVLPKRKPVEQEPNPLLFSKDVKVKLEITVANWLHLFKNDNCTNMSKYSKVDFNKVVPCECTNRLFTGYLAVVTVNFPLQPFFKGILPAYIPEKKMHHENGQRGDHLGR